MNYNINFKNTNLTHLIRPSTQ